MQRRRVCVIGGWIAAVLVFAQPLFAQASADWTEPFPPFRIAGNLYYVGSKGLANYLITTPEGHILISATHTHSAATALGSNRYTTDQSLDEYQRFVARRVAEPLVIDLRDTVSA